jgi:hypothetical protein
MNKRDCHNFPHLQEKATNGFSRSDKGLANGFPPEVQEKGE